MLSSRSGTSSDTAEQRYERKQSLTWLVFLGAVVASAVGSLPHSDSPSRFAWFVLVGVASAIGYFGGLLLVVDEQSVRWYVGGKSGWPRGYIPLVRIAQVEQIELGFFEGWHAHWTIWQGWRWDVLRFRAVEITTRDGTRTILGTGAPNALYNAIVERRGLSA